MYSESYWDLIPLHDEHPRQIALKKPQSQTIIDYFYGRVPIWRFNPFHHPQK